MQNWSGVLRATLCVFREDETIDDDQQYPETQMAVFEYPGDGTVGHRRQLIYEMRLWSINYPLNADIEIGHRTAALCHLGNLSARLGRSFEIDTNTEQIVGDAEANQLLRREYRTSHWSVPKEVA